MSDVTSQLKLPVIPLNNGVVFPHMVVTIRLETNEARLATAAARDHDGRLLLIPRVDGRYAKVGTIAQIQDSDDAGNEKCPETQCFRAFQLVAGAGFEPATFGL